MTWASSTTAEATINADRPGHRGGRRASRTISATPRGGERQHGPTVAPGTAHHHDHGAARGDVGSGVQRHPRGHRRNAALHLVARERHAAVRDWAPSTAAGVISGTPTATGTSSFTVKVTAGAQSVTKTLSITVTPSVAMIWPSNPDARHRRRRRYEPGDAGCEVPAPMWLASSRVCASTRPVPTPARTSGILWSSTGQSLATVALHGRDELGLAAGRTSRAPVAITGQHGLRRILLRATTATTAATSTTSRRRAWTRRRCTRSRPASPAATACTRYGAAGTFPTSTYQVAQLLGGRGLQRPAGADADVDRGHPGQSRRSRRGATQQYTATGTYSDSSTQNLTSQVTWASSNTAAATINVDRAGDRGCRPGPRPSLATLGSRERQHRAHRHSRGRSRITTTALPVATVGAAYTATLAATGGTPPYMWFAGEWDAARRADPRDQHGGDLGYSDGDRHLQLQRRGHRSGLGQRDGAAEHHGELLDARRSGRPIPRRPSWTAATRSPGRVGVKFVSEVPGFVSGVRFYKSSGQYGGRTSATCGRTPEPRLATVTFSGDEVLGWEQMNFSTPVAVPLRHPLPRVLLRAQRALQRKLRLLRDPASTRTRCTRWPTRRRGGNGVFSSTAPRASFPTSTYRSHELLGRRGVQRAGDRAADVDRGDAGPIRRWASAGPRSSSRPPARTPTRAPRT